MEPVGSLTWRLRVDCVPVKARFRRCEAGSRLSHVNLDKVGFIRPYPTKKIFFYFEKVRRESGRRIRSWSRSVKPIPGDQGHLALLPGGNCLILGDCLINKFTSNG